MLRRIALAAALFALAGCTSSEEAPAAPPKCEATDWAGCIADAQRLEAKSPDVALAFYSKACTGGFARGCVHQGLAEEKADKPLEAQKSFDTACTRGDLAGCARLGQLHEHGKDWRITIDYSKAIALYKRACEGGEGLGCVYLAEMHEHSHGMPPNDFKETGLYIKGCEKKSMLSCWRLAQRYRSGRGARKNEPKATELATRACAGGVAEACATK